MSTPPKAYLSAYGALYGDTPLKDIPKRRSFNGGKRAQPERDQQIILCAWLDKNDILYYAIPNGARRNKIEAYNLKRSGLKPGVPDICIPIGNKDYHALYIEMKVENNKPTDAQNYWIRRLNNKGNLAKVCYSAEEAKRVVRDYLGI